jgi:hypothetical protein
MLAIARAMAALCAWIRRLLTCCSETLEILAASEAASLMLICAMKRTEFVAIWVAHICQVHGTPLALTQAWWFFN